MKHKHAELIKAWVDGADVQYRWKHWHANEWEEWRDLICLSDFNDAINFEYRLKPEPKPDIVKTFRVSTNSVFNGMHISDRLDEEHNLKIIFDGETGELKSAEVLK